MEKKKNKKERNYSRRQSAETFPPMSESSRVLSGKASFCTSAKKGSLAIETAMVLPLFFLGIVTILSFMDVYQLETEKLVHLCEQVKETGMYAYALDESGPEEISLPALYSYTPVISAFPLPKVWLHNIVKVHAWTGKGADEGSTGDEEETEEMVWVTESGVVFHTNAKCSYLNLSIHEVSGASVGRRKNDYGEHYDACETCSRNQKPSEIVYITDSGNSYHNQGTCSALKRTVRMVTSSQVEDMHVCSRCG